MEKPTLETKRLILRPFQNSDFEANFALRSNPEVRKFVGGPMSADQVKKHLQKIQGEWTGEDNEWLGFAVELKETKQFMGEFSVRYVKKERMQCEIGYQFNTQFHGKGYATEAARRGLTYCFENLNAHRVIAICDVLNSASYRLMERIGMAREGRLRHNDLIQDQWYDNYLYAIIKTD